MAKAFRRFRIKRGPGTWDNVVQTTSGTKTSRSNKTHNTTTNVSRTRIRTHQNNGGWIMSRSRPMHPKTRSSQKSKKHKSDDKTLIELLFFRKKKKTPARKKPVGDTSISWIERLNNSLQRAADARHAAEAERKIIAPKEVKEDTRKVTYVTDKEAGFTASQKRFMLLTLFVVIFAIQKCSG